jgi:LytS/YehU family sensor histidine kinase
MPRRPRLTVNSRSLLRRALEDSGRQLVTLAGEVSILENYIELQTMRLGDRPRVTVNVETLENKIS